MNWLAHLRLAPAAGRLRIGNLAGDFVRGVDLGQLDAQVRTGVLQHRAIDRFVDAHQTVRRSRARLGPEVSRYSGVLVDVFYDHFLARDWSQHGDGRALRQFVDEVQAELFANVAVLPPRLAELLPWLQREDWLGSYATLPGIDAILLRMAKRSERRAPLRGGGRELRQHYAELAADFAEFWPQLQAHARELHAPGV